MFPSRLTFFNGGETGSFIINDRAGSPDLWSESPYYYISADSVDGLRGADISSEAHPIPNAIGESPGDVFRRGKTITISGKVKALNLSALEQGVDYLEEMFAEKNLRKLVMTRWADGITVYFNCQINQDLAVVETIDSFDYQYLFTVGLRASDPRSRKFSDDTVYPPWQE